VKIFTHFGVCQDSGVKIFTPLWVNLILREDGDRGAQVLGRFSMSGRKPRIGVNMCESGKRGRYELFEYWRGFVVPGFPTGNPFLDSEIA